MFCSDQKYTAKKFDEKLRFAITFWSSRRAAYYYNYYIIIREMILDAILFVKAHLEYYTNFYHICTRIKRVSKRCIEFKQLS